MLIPLIVFIAVTFFILTAYLSLGRGNGIRVAIATLLIAPEYLAVRIGHLPEINTMRSIMVLLAITILFNSTIFSGSMRLRLRSPSTQYILSITPFLFCRVLSSTLSPTNFLRASFTSLNDVSVFIILPFAITYTSRSPRSVRQLLNCILLTAAFTLPFAWQERILNHNFLIDLFPASSRAFAFRDILRDSTYRVKSTFVHPLAFAEYLSILLSLSLARLRAINTSSSAILYCALSTAIIFTMLLTVSRSAYIAAAILILIWVLTFTYSRTKAAMSIFIFAIILLSFEYFYLYSDTHSIIKQFAGASPSELASNAERLQQYALGLPMIMAKPFLGYGPSNAMDVLGLDTIDNYYLVLCLESGIFACLFFLLFILWTAYSIYILAKRGSRRLAHSPTYSLAFCLVAILFFTLISSLRFSNYCLAIIAGCLISSLSSTPDSDVSQTKITQGCSTNAKN